MASENYEWQPSSGKANEPVTAANVDSLRTWEPRFSRASVSDEAGASNSRILFNRVGICCIAVGLLWLTTLDMSAAIADAHYKSVGLNAVVDSWEKSVEVIVMEENAYELCANRALYECNQSFNDSVSYLDADLKARFTANEATVQVASDVAGSCQGTYVQMSKSLLRYQTLGYTILYKSDVCSAAQIDEVQTLLGDASEQTAYAYSLSTDYTRSNSYLMMQATESVANYTSYNYDYFTTAAAAISLDVGTLLAMSPPKLAELSAAVAPLDEAVDSFIDCTVRRQCTSGQTVDCCSHQSVADVYDDMVGALNVAYVATANALAANIDALNQTYIDMQAELAEAKAFVDRVDPYWDNVQQAVQEISDVDLPGVGTWSPKLQLVNNYKPNLALVTPEFADYFYTFGDAYIANLTEDVAEAGQAVVDGATGWADAINITMFDTPTLLSDYDPPEVDLHSDEMAENTDAFLSAQATALGEIYTSVDTGGSGNITDTIIAYIETNVVSPSSINVTLTDFNTETEFSFYNFLDVFSTISAGFIFVDYAWRIFTSLHIIVRYWSTSAVGLPLVDVRQFKTTQKTPAAVRLARILTNPFVLYGGLLAAAVIGLTVLLSVYLPIYNEFRHGCIETHDGTLLSKNTAAFAINFATISGAGAIADGLRDYDALRNSKCSAYSNKAATDYSTFVSAWNDADAVRVDSMGKVWKIQHCIEFNSTGITFLPVAYEAMILDEDGVTPNTHPLTLNETSLCWEAAPQPVTMSFNCTDMLPACDIGCSGPSVPLITYTTHQSSCASEDLIHSYLLKLFTAVTIYVCLNVSRVVFVKAVGLLMWRSITPFGFSFVGSCSRSGKMTVNAKTLLQAETAIMVQKFNLQAMGMLIFSGLIHLPWLLMLVYIS